MNFKIILILLLISSTQNKPIENNVTNPEYVKIYINDGISCVKYCFHRGLCKKQMLKFNITHDFLMTYCVCQFGYSGKRCQVDISFLFDIEKKKNEKWINYTW
jgi:hypothetical protein